MKHFFVVAGGLGKLFAFFSILMCAPAVVSLLADDGLAWVYLKNAGLVAVLAAVLVLIGRLGGRRQDMAVRDGLLLVLLTWILLPALAALPLLDTLTGLTFIKAYFEAASGLTATGATVLTGLDEMPPSLHFWRGEMIWLGGMGLIVLAVAVLPFLGGGSGAMMQTELPGPIKDEKLKPQIAQTAKSLWFIYAGLTGLCCAAYWLAGMSLLDAAVHAFTTLGLGGFSTHDASYAYFNSPLIEAIATVFMVIAGVNFALHYSALSAKSALMYWRNLECRSYLTVLLAAAILIPLYLWLTDEYDFGAAWRYGIFNTVSIVTTTGYSNTDYGAWPLFAPLLMLLLANITSCGGSTGGGIKMMRVLVLAYQTETETQKHLHPQAYYSNRAFPAMPQKHITSVLFFILAYLATAVALMLALVATEMDFFTAFSAALATLSNTGPGLGEVGPAASYAQLTPLQTALCAFSMLIGRLELLSFIIMMRRSFWVY